MIELIKINKSFGDTHILKNISECFEESKTNLIIGQSGSGKTVLLKSIIGLHGIDTGNILYDGRDFSTMNNSQRKEIRKEIGMVFQGSALFDSLSVEENVEFPLKMFTNYSKKEIKKRVDFCLERVDIINANKQFPAEISGGMQKRVAIARAIALNPKYLFCDEPNSGLDPKTSIIIDKLIHEITRDYKITTIINTHDMNSLMEIGENIIFIDNGEKSWKGNKNDIFNSNNERLNDFVFASSLFKKIKTIHNK